MKRIQTKIGDHSIELICESEKAFEYIKKRFNSKDVEDEPHLTLKINDGYGVSFCGYDVEIQKHDHCIYYRRADYLIEVEQDFKYATLSVYDELALKHALTNLYSAFIVHHNWGLLIHSSCAIEKGKAHVFAGHSGAGKSTAAKLSYPRTLLSDEATLLKISDDCIQVFNSPFRSELESDSFEGAVNLESVQILFQALNNKKTLVSKSDALIQLIDKVFFWPQNQNETIKILKLLTMVVNQVPVYHLHFQKNNTFWELIS
jgi:hypothetical protein